MALNEDSANSVMADPASDKVEPDGTGQYLLQRQLTPLLTKAQASYSSILGFPHSKTPFEADLLMLRSG
jgi:hypothetical protein